MAERTSQEIMDVFLEEVRQAEEASTTGERMKHYHIAEEEYKFISEADDGFFSSAEQRRAARAMQHLNSLIEGDADEQVGVEGDQG